MGVPDNHGKVQASTMFVSYSLDVSIIGGREGGRAGIILCDGHFGVGA